MKRILLTAAIGAIMATSAQAQSFNCNTARRADEQAICDNSELSRLDRQLNRIYRNALREVGNPSRLLRRQRDWLADRRSCGWSESCIRRAYTSRIGELQRIAY